jgi:hypothetical protein
MPSTWELHFEPMPAPQMGRMQDFLMHIRAGRPDVIDWLVDPDGTMHVMFDDLQHLRMVIEACDHNVQLKSLTVEFGSDVAKAQIELPWEADDVDHHSIELVTG